MSDTQHDMEVNRMIRLIIQLQQNYDTIIITALDTKKSPIIKPTYIAEDESKSKIFEDMHFIIDDFGSENFKIKFAKINFDNLIHISDSKNTIEKIRDNYLNSIESIIIECFEKQDDFPNLREKYRNALEIELNSKISGDIRSIKSCYKSILNEFKGLSDYELLCIIKHNFSDTLKYFFKQSNLKYDESLFEGLVDAIEYSSFRDIVDEAVRNEMWIRRSLQAGEEIRNNTDISIFKP